MRGAGRAAPVRRRGAAARLGGGRAFILSPSPAQEGLLALFEEHGPVVRVKFLPVKVALLPAPIPVLITRWVGGCRIMPSSWGR